MAGMRDILAYKYFGIDLEIAWETIKNILPLIEPKIKKIYNLVKLNDEDNK